MRQLLLLLTLMFAAVAKAQDTTGVVVAYHENGNKKSEGEYYKGYKIGFWQTWYEDGKLRSKENYSVDKELIDAINREGIISQGYELNIGRYFIDSKGVFEGKSEWFYPNGQISAEELWSKKEVIVTNWDKSGEKESLYSRRSNDKTKGIWRAVQVDGERWEELAKKEWKAAGLKAKGTVLVYFMIEESGQIDEVEIRKSSNNPELDALAIKIVKLIPIVAPVRKHNLPERSGCGFNVNFNNGVHVPLVF